MSITLLTFNGKRYDMPMLSLAMTGAGLSDVLLVPDIAAAMEHLGNDERVQEMARMLGGATVTEQTLLHAKELKLFDSAWRIPAFKAYF